MSHSDLILSSIVPPSRSISGRSQEQWSVNWWRYIYRLPADENHPSLDSTGEKADTGQSPPLFYFVGTFNESGRVTRQVRLEPQQGYQSLFMPLVNVQFDSAQLPDLNPEQIRGVTQAVADTALRSRGGELFAALDGAALGNLESYRQTSSVFQYSLVENNLLGLYAGLVTHSFADGFYIGIDLAALPPEQHAIEFGGVVNLESLDIPDNLRLEDLENTFQSFGQIRQDITYQISFDLNEIQGTNSRVGEDIRGTQGWDEISGLNGKDYIVAREGNDVLRGGNGVDTLIGTNPYECHPGSGEIDIFYGGNGADTFVLGEYRKVYYTGHGLQDYALIKDFSTEDTIQLQGKSSQYELGENYSLGSQSGTGIFLTQTSELIGFVEGVTGLNLDNHNFSFLA